MATTLQNDPGSSLDSDQPTTAAMPGGMASVQGMIVPPLLLAVLLLIVLMILSVLSQPRWWRTCFCPRTPHRDVETETKARVAVTLCTPEDRDILDRLSRFQNRPWSLFLLSRPSLVSLVFCPLSLILLKPMLKAFWPDNLFPEGHPNVNGAISAFLTPAGLVYAIAFGFAMQEAVRKQEVVAQRIAAQLNKMIQIRVLAGNVSAVTLSERKRILTILKNEIIKLFSSVMKEKTAVASQTEGGSENLWSILKIVKRVRESGQTTDVENSFCDQLVQQTFELDSVASDRLGQLGATMKGIQWFFLESLGMFSFFGILLLKADSYRLEITMCMLTVFSISLFCYVLADLDQPYHGVFKVNLGVLVEFIEHTHNEFQSLQEVEAVDMQPPPNLFGKTSLGTMHE